LPREWDANGLAIAVQASSAPVKPRRIDARTVNAAVDAVRFNQL
jgi:hypothetical protein